MDKWFLTLELINGKMYDYDDGNYQTSVYGFTKGQTLQLPKGFTHMGIVIDGSITIEYEDRVRYLIKWDFFSVKGEAVILSQGMGMVNSANNYEGFNLFGWPIEEQWRLRYIDGCTDTLLVPPVRKWDPCLNHLHFPSGITQTPHTHPSVRTGIVIKWAGMCILPEDNLRVPLVTGYAFIIKTETVHSFDTTSDEMDIIAFHPDSDVWMTDEDHPMINRTIVNWVSAKYCNEIRTK